MRVAIVGGGAFGTALSVVLGSRLGEVRLWMRDREAAAQLNRTRQTSHALPGFPIPARVLATSDWDMALEAPDLILCALPSKAVRSVFDGRGASIPAGVPLVSVTKGLEQGTLKTPVEVLEDCLPAHRELLVALSGPSFAQELAQGMPTAVTVACRDESVAVRCQHLLQSETLRLYTTSDRAGVELGGALKNVIAIAVGIAEGLGFGHNARAALITRGLAEIARLAVRRGAQPLTLSGLSGLGDLVLTCTGELSRNRRVGLELGRGRPLAEVLEGLGHVAEGIETALSVRELSVRAGIETPICEQVCRIAHEGRNPRDAVAELMARGPRAELL